MQNSMVMFTFFVFGWKYPVWDNFVQNIKIVSLRWNLIPRLIWICWIQWCCSLFRFRPETPFLGKFDPNCQYLQFFFVSNQKCHFLGKFGPKCHNYQFKSSRLNLLASLIQIYRILGWCSLFSFSIGNAVFWADLVEKAKMISLSGNFVDTYCFR